MRKRSLSGQALKTKDWMRYRPYERFSPYDGYYMKQANAIFDRLNRPDHGFRQHFEREHLKELAILIAAHFEDFINDIGLWRTLTRKHTELYGYALPFYNLDDYDPDYLNPQDFAYLIWHQLSNLSGKTISPQSPAIMNMADYCFDFFEKRIEDASGTDFYDSWLSIGPDTAFFDLKYRLKWMAFSNYLTGPEFSGAMQEGLEELLTNDSKNFQEMDPGKLAYALEDEFLYKKNSSWCAMTIPDWLAEIARCPDEIRPEIRQVSQRVYGMFLYEGCDERFYHFRYIRTNRLFHIRRESIELETDTMQPGLEAGNFGIVNWLGDWWLSGTYMAWTITPKHLENFRLDSRHISFFGWTEADQQRIRENSAEMEEGFIAYFGDRLVVFPNQKEMTDALTAQREWWNSQLTQKTGKKMPNKSKTSKLLAKKSQDMEDFDFGSRGNFAVFFVPGEGQLISPVIPDLIRLLQADKLSKQESEQLFYTFFRDCQPPLAHLLVERFSGKNLHFPFIDDPAFVARHFEFFMRYYNPGAFREVVPNLSLVALK